MYTQTGIVYNFTITLANLYVSPLTYNYTSDYFQVSTYTNTNLQIDVTDPIAVPASRTAFVLTCSLVTHCKTCLDSNTSYCLSCYKLGDGYYPTVTYGGYSMMNSNNVCVDICGDGYYNASGACQACTTPCMYCTSSTACTSCVAGYYYIASNPSSNRCVNSCPNGSYADGSSNLCVGCSSSCNSCNGSATTCTSCVSPLYLSGSQCIAACPDGTYEDNGLRKCMPCDISCNSTCGANSTDCTACRNGYYHINSTTS